MTVGITRDFGRPWEIATRPKASASERFPEGPYDNPCFHRVMLGSYASAALCAGIMWLLAGLAIDSSVEAWVWGLALLSGFGAIATVFFFPRFRPPVSYRFGTAGMLLEFRSWGRTSLVPVPWSRVIRVQHSNPRHPGFSVFVTLPFEDPPRKVLVKDDIALVAWHERKIEVTPAAWEKMGSYVSPEAKALLKGLHPLLVKEG
jgi:hypothetical protein